MSTNNTNHTWEGKRILITGGTRGLGLHLTQEFVDHGAIVTIVSRTKEDLIKIADTSDQIYMIEADLSAKEDIHKIVGQAIGMMEGIDVLINNASSLGPVPLVGLSDLTCEDFEEVLQTNLLGPFRLTKAVLPYMKFHHSGLIVNISSDAAVSAYPTWGAYSVSKSGLDHLTSIWQVESEPNISFVSIDPGDMQTKMHFDAIPDADPADLSLPVDVAKAMLSFLSVPTYDQTRYSAEEWRAVIQ